MARPEIEFRSYSATGLVSEALAGAVSEISRYPIHRVYMDVKTKTAAYTMDPILDRIILGDGTSFVCPVTLPRAASADHVEYVVKAIGDGSNIVTLTTDSADGTLDGTDINAAPITIDVNNSIRVVSDGTNWFRTDIND